MRLLELFPYLLSAITMTEIWLAGNKWNNVWLLGIANCILWTIYTVLTKQWGLMPLNVFAGAIAIRNHLKWNKK